MSRSGYMENIVPWKSTDRYREGKLVSFKNKLYRTKEFVPKDYTLNPEKGINFYHYIQDLPKAPSSV